MKHFLLTLTISITLCTITNAQVATPPSLGLGIAGVIGEKGSIDVDLLTEIISDKQAELKKEFIKKTFYEKISKENYTTWEYVYNTMEVLLEAESKDAIKKNLLENSANLAFVYGFAEMYLQLSYRLGNDALDEFKDSVFCLSRNDSINFNNGKAEEKPYQGVLLTDLRRYKKKNGDKTLSAAFLDMVYEILKTNPTVTNQLGFINTSYPLGKEFFDKHSAYRLSIDTTFADSIYNNIYEKVNETVQLIFDNYILLKYLKNRSKSLEDIGGVFLNRIDSLREKLRLDSINTHARIDSTTSNAKVFEEMKFQGKQALKSLSNIQLSNQSFLSRSDSDNGNTAIAITSDVAQSSDAAINIYQVVTEFSKFLNEDYSDLSQYDIYYLEKFVRPFGSKLLLETNYDAGQLSLIDDFESLIVQKQIDKLKSDYDGNDFIDTLFHTDLSTFKSLLDFVNNLDELNKVETYEVVMNTIQTTADIFEDQKIGNYLRVITENVDRFTLLDEEENKVEIKVEDLISAIYNTYGNRQSSNVDFYFSVGLNQTFDGHFDIIRNADTTLQNSFGFASEKIGLKFKLLNFKKRNNFKVGETYENWGLLTNLNLFGSIRKNQPTREVKHFRSKEPIVSDVYLLPFGSGLLYNLTNLSTEEEFDAPILGLAFGVAFFNGLDLNIAWNRPLRPENEVLEQGVKNWVFDGKFQSFFTIGLDIKISEYLTKVREKRNKAKLKEAN